MHAGSKGDADCSSSDGESSGSDASSSSDSVGPLNDILNSCSCIHVTISSRIQDDDDDGEKDEHGEDLGSSRKAEEKEACMNPKKKEEVVDSISPANSGPTCIHSCFFVVLNHACMIFS